MNGQIFISYRREESRWSARSLHDRLCRDFDPKQIFMDIDAIPLGEDFVKAIKTRVANCDVLVAVIGNNWLTCKDDHGDRRLDNPEDFVRMEIATALSREIRVIPVLVDGALMPRTTDLPEDLKALVRRNALRITDTSFDGDCQRLATAIRLLLEELEVEQGQLHVKERLANRGEVEKARASSNPDPESKFQPPPKSPSKPFTLKLVLQISLLTGVLVACLVLFAPHIGRNLGNTVSSVPPAPTPTPSLSLTPTPPPAPTPTPPPSLTPTPPPSPTTTLPTLGEVTVFVQSHLGSVENRQLDVYMSAYNNEVHWYDAGYVPASHIRQQMKDFLRKWDNIAYRVTGPIQLENLSDPDRVRARYHILLDLENSETQLHRAHTETVEIEKVHGSLKIVSERWD